jgi:hypothetical protein
MTITLPTWFLWCVVAWGVLDILATIALIDRPREPIGRRQAAATVCLWLVLIVMLVVELWR